DWTSVAAQVGMVAINPRLPPVEVIGQLRGCSRVMAESLHGAICADALAIPWAPCVLAHRFNDFKWRDWLATIDRPFRPMVADRPLVRSISKPKAVVNHVARWLTYKAQTRRPLLRPVASASAQDVHSVALSLLGYARQSSHIAFSRPSDIVRQRQRMRAACEAFAHDYHLRFTP
ncbi:MAG: hypothetical protein ACR2I0_03480, partial [Rhodoferax sp.]